VTLEYFSPEPYLLAFYSIIIERNLAYDLGSLGTFRQGLVLSNASSDMALVAGVYVHNAQRRCLHHTPGRYG
jgi:hypothetical protein